MHVMIDLETLTTSPNAQIVAIRAVKFDFEGIKDEFYTNIKLTKNTLFDINPETVEWWLKQSKTAQEQLLIDAQPINSALCGFISFFISDMPQGLYSKNFRGKEVWGNGATFDNVILRNAYEKLNINCLWHYRYDRCYRSTKYILPEEEFVRVGEHHNALDDAKSQALHLIKICNKAGIVLK